MRIGIVGAGNIGGNLAAQWARRGHDVVISFKRDPDELAALAEATGTTAGGVEDAVAHGEVVVLSVPWGTVDEIAAQANLNGKVLVDTTNQSARGGLADVPSGLPAAEYNARR